MSSDGRQIAKAATQVMALFVLSRMLGLARQMVISGLFGTSGALDAYMAAARIPEMIFLVIAGGAVGSAFIPPFADHLAKGDRTGAWRLASAVINLALIALIVAAGLMALSAPMLVRTIIAPGFPPSRQALTVKLLRLMLLSPIIFGVSGVVMGTLNAHQHFLLPALAPSAYNLATIGGAALLGPRIGVIGLVIGGLVGAGLHLLVQVPGLLHYRADYIPTLGLNLSGVHEVGRLIAPRMLGTAIAQLNFVVNNGLASGMGEGAVSAINYAWMLMLLPQGVFAQAIGTAAFPTFAEQSARGEKAEMRSVLASTLRAVFFLSIPATVGLIVLARPLVALLFEHGAFKTSSTEAVAWALAFYALGLVGHAGLEIIARAFYALHDTFTPVWVGAVAVGINVALSFTLPGVFGPRGWPRHAGLALANAVATLLELVLLMALVWQRMDGLEGRKVLTTIVKSVGAALTMGITLMAWQAALSGTNPLMVGGGGIVLGLGIYIGAAFLLRTQELRAVMGLMRA